jgi:hypothetical protein
MEAPQQQAAATPDAAAQSAKDNRWAAFEEQVRAMRDAGELAPARNS